MLVGSSSRSLKPNSVVVEEARWTGDREPHRRVDVGQVVDRTLHLVGTLADPETALLVGREVVDHRVPDRAGELREVRIVRTERLELVEVARPGVVLVEERRGRVAEDERGVPGRAVGGRGEREDRHLEPTRERDRLGVVGPHELREPEAAELVLEVGQPERRQEDLRALVDVRRQPRRVVVVVVQVRDVEVVGPLERRHVEGVVPREREPRPEVRGVEPRITEHRAALGLHEHPHVTEERDPHRPRLPDASPDPAHG